MKKLLYFLFLMVIVVLPTCCYAANEVNIYFFNEDNCDFCSQEKVYLEALKQRYPNIRVYSYEVSASNNFNLMQEAKEMYGITESGVPFTVIGDAAYTGFSQSKKAIFQRKVYEFSLNGYENKLGKKLGIEYRNDLDVEIKEYKDNADYKIEETSGIIHPPIKSSSKTNKYKVSICLIITGIDLGILLWIVYLLEKRKENSK